MRKIHVRTWALSITIFFSLILAPSAAAQNGGTDDADLWGTMFFSYIVFPLLYIIHKTILVRRVKRSMHALSEDVGSEYPMVLDVPGRPAQVQPEILEFDMKNDLPEALEHREKVLSQALNNLNRRWRSEFFASVVYVSLPMLMGILSRQPYQETWWVVIVLVAIYFILISISYAINRADFSPENWSFGLAAPQLKWIEMIIKPLLNPGYDILLWLFLGGVLISGTYPGAAPEDSLSSEATPMLFFIGVCIAVAFHLGLLVRRWFAPHEGPNIKLLVLRVFGSSRSAILTFDRLIRFWRKFGLHFTIDDPDFAKHRYRFFQFRTLTQFFLVFFAGAISAWASLIIFALIVIYDWHGLIIRRPVRDQEHARQRIQQTMAKPRKADGTFKDLRMVAYMNTWKLVVDEFIKVVDVVLFDVREYTEQRKGAQYEVDFIFDTFPADRVVFLRTTDSDQEAIHRLIMDRWAQLRESSPNRDIPDPVIRIYVSGKQKGPDVQGLMDLLLYVAR